MKEIYSKKLNRNKIRKAKLKKYWRTLEPKKYVDEMIASGTNLIKIAYADKKSPVDLYGILKKTKKGFHYLDISNDVINGLFTLISETEGKIEKPPYFDKDGIGAHISVISDEEELPNKNIKELGEEFKFTLGDFYSTKPEGWNEVEKVWFVEVNSPELKELRKKYKLPATYKDKGHEFHITVALRYN